MRVRENAESIAFYGGEASERRLLFDRLKAVVENYADLLKTSRNLEFFTSFYRQDAWRSHLVCCFGASTACSSSVGQDPSSLPASFALLWCGDQLSDPGLDAARFLIQILPASVVAPLYFQGKIGFGVINQSSSAFNHILSDVSLIVYQVGQLLQQAARLTGASQRMLSQNAQTSSKSCPFNAIGSNAV